MTRYHNVASLYLGFQKQSSEPFLRFQHKIRSRYHEILSTRIAQVPLVSRLACYPSNVENFTRIVTNLAATQHIFELRFTSPFIHPNPAKDDYVPAIQERKRAVKYSLQSDGYNLVRRDLMRQLGDVTVLRTVHNRLIKGHPPLPLFHALRYDSQAKIAAKSQMTIVKRLNREQAFKEFDKIRKIDATKEFGVLVADSFILIYNQTQEEHDAKIFPTKIRIPFLGSK
ncbi:uncharacterized protein LY89DRAFT_22016 [Mollisia scopiformis]|uniref:Uncharacterized protein n=1 Tax=Mollisia scopiformis TaxID=149040 RepID=A0A194XVP3_MOLSC|nr:uncharacterized protein LY89DRAFT_22016 [Mollisia scopiformis]KUJ24400.1 hypothetical protein LY89DRAFT_22016 [Mollisia scopiformis]